MDSPRLPQIDRRRAEAVALLRSCLGRNGVWASPDRYRYQCWTRDFGLAILPLLLGLGLADAARRHLTSLSERQRPNGQMPILFLDDEAAWVALKEVQAARSSGDGEPFMLRRYREGELWNLTPGTRDSELWYLHAMHEYAETTGDRSLLEKYADTVERALAYLEGSLLRDGLMVGADWRDTMHVELADKPLLSNNAALCHVYRMMGDVAKAEALRARLLETHFVPAADGGPGRFIDYPGTDRFDPLGGAFLVLFHVVEADHYAAIAAGFASVDTPAGVTILCKHKPGSTSRPDEAEAIERTGGVVVWPFVAAYAALAGFEMVGPGQPGVSPRDEAAAVEYFDFARGQAAKAFGLPGFWEWHDPAEAVRGLPGRGAELQGWSAFLLARLADEVRPVSDDGDGRIAI